MSRCPQGLVAFPGCLVVQHINRPGPLSLSIGCHVRISAPTLRLGCLPATLPSFNSITSVLYMSAIVVGIVTAFGWPAPGRRCFAGCLVIPCLP